MAAQFAAWRGFGFAELSRGHLPWPWLFGDVSHYAGRGFIWEGCLFIGACAMLLALYAAWAERGALVLAGLAAATLLLALGAHTPLFGWLYRFFPGYDFFRGTAKFSFLSALFLAVLAGRGYDRLALRRPLRYALLALAAAEMALFARGARANFELNLFYPEAWMQEVRKNPGDYRVWHDPLRQPNTAMILGLQDIWGYDSFVLKRYAFKDERTLLRRPGHGERADDRRRD